MKTTGDQQLVKHINRSVLLRLVRARPGLSRAQLATESGLTKSTVGLLTKELLEEGWLEESDVTTQAGLGRPSTPLQINSKTRGLLGVELAVDCIRAVGVSLLGEVICSEHEKLSSNAPEQVCQQLAILVAKVYAQLVNSGYQPSGLGVGLPGAFDEATGAVWFAPNLAWRQVNILPKILSALGKQGISNMPVHVQNDADAGALSEYEFVSGVTNSALVFVACGVGVGAGIVLNDRLFTGAQGMAGEIGHSIMQINGPLCSCGRQGCAETFIGAKAVVRDIAETGHANQAGTYLGILIHNLWTTFNPSVIVLGGASCIENPHMVRIAQDVLREHATRSGMSAPPIRTARYGLLASAVGAAALVLHHYLQPLPNRQTQLARQPGEASSLELPQLAVA
jgi:predicted NBD/HSP70 family sugar kinase/DNA-binding XRE family transcriptional regulator